MLTTACSVQVDITAFFDGGHQILVFLHRRLQFAFQLSRFSFQLVVLAGQVPPLLRSDVTGERLWIDVIIVVVVNFVIVVHAVGVAFIGVVL